MAEDPDIDPVFRKPGRFLSHKKNSKNCGLCTSPTSSATRQLDEIARQRYLTPFRLASHAEILGVESGRDHLSQRMHNHRNWACNDTGTSWAVLAARSRFRERVTVGI